jgi:hypothetical protein
MRSGECNPDNALLVNLFAEPLTTPTAIHHFKKGCRHSVRARRPSFDADRAFPDAPRWKRNTATALFVLSFGAPRL